MMRSTRCLEAGAGRSATGFAALEYALALHVRDLSEHGQDDLADAFGNRPDPVDFHDNAFGNQPANRGLNVQGIAAQPVNGIDADDIAGPDERQKLGESKPLSRWDSTADAFVLKLAVEPSAQGVALGFNRLVRSRDPVISDAAQKIVPSVWGLKTRGQNRSGARF